MQIVYLLRKNKAYSIFCPGKQFFLCKVSHFHKYTKKIFSNCKMSDYFSKLKFLIFSKNYIFGKKITVRNWKLQGRGNKLIRRNDFKRKSLCLIFGIFVFDFCSLGCIKVILFLRIFTQLQWIKGKSFENKFALLYFRRFYV